MSASYAHHRRPPHSRRHHVHLLTWPMIMVGLLVAAALGFVIYVLWPRWPATPAGPDAPALPITVAGVSFNVPAAAIRRVSQREPGAHERVDLSFLWPSLAPPDSAILGDMPTKGKPRPRPFDRIFVTLAVARDSPSPGSRVQMIYPRYAESEPSAGPDGLAVLPFRNGTPYQGEDLIYDAAAPAHFLVRCSRNGARATPGICLQVRRIGEADVTVRFPRDWLDDWRTVSNGIEKLIGNLRPTGG